MIVSHRHQFIFVKTQRTAGTSIEIALSQICGPDDLITPLLPEDEAGRQEHGGRGPQNFIWEDVPYPTFCEILQKTPFQWAVPMIGRQYEKDKSLHAYNHIPASNVRRLIHPETWKRYYKFCVERDPVDKIRSYYRWSQTQRAAMSINDFIKSGQHCMVSDFELYTENGQMLVDRVYPLEKLAEWWPAVCKRIGLSKPLQLPSAKSSSRPNSQEPLSDPAKLQVSVDFAREIRLFGYEAP